ncbi:helix-turn-helix domain-containing protein [Ulvibacterium marinum]|uniref:AraC family transcriptional regulator n=1 Tax=Ulvibacterium marinum TaxID=2419782 RepID=A0A3B0BQQ1_9FLAO|nr:AraC family transcriptional regulator [Ulvibacterium marinum]RKN75120.1 AraC family transcriptional regulator [Ulvibacterium marinum]
MKNKIEIRDLDVRDVVKDIADTLGTAYEEDNNEMCFDIPEEIGKGYVKAVSFSHGVGIIDLDIHLKKEVHLLTNQSSVQPLKIIFNRESSIEHRFEGKSKIREIRHLESAILSCNSKHGHTITLPANQPICFFSLEINRKLFEEKIEDFLPDMNPELEGLFRDVNGINLFFHKGHYTLDIAKCIEQCIDSELVGFTRSVFLEGKAYEILAHHLRQYLDDLTDPDKRKILRQATVEKIEKAANIIEEELESMDNIIALARRVGLNQNTLQNGFKHLYGMSVNQYIRNARIEMAKNLMENTDLNITEITYKIGINSRSYFSKLFKNRYAMTPTQYLQKLRGNRNKTAKIA